MYQDELDEIYMRRCLHLAACGRGGARPNPMVGAVIVAHERIIGEGFHVRCGEGHAEVNAFASVRQEDEPLLPESTIYVSLEPCSHYGKTPPCAELIIKKGVKRVVVGTIDPFSKVQGRGVKMLESAGIEVKVGVLEDECRHLNRQFFTFHTKKRPYIILKWAQSANGFIDNDFKPTAISTPYTKMLSHKLRSESDAILVGRTTDERDNPQLNVREWAGNNPRRIVIDSRKPCFNGLDFSLPVVPQLLQWLYSEGLQSLIVEGGAHTLQSFITSDAWDEIRVETAPVAFQYGTKAPQIPPNVRLSDRKEFDGNVIATFLRA